MMQQFLDIAGEAENKPLIDRHLAGFLSRRKKVTWKRVASSFVPDKKCPAINT